MCPGARVSSLHHRSAEYCVSTVLQSTSPSYSVGANFQEVLSIMKKHNNKLCKSPRQHSRGTLKLSHGKVRLTQLHVCFQTDQQAHAAVVTHFGALDHAVLEFRACCAGVW